MKWGIFQGAFPLGWELSRCLRLAKEVGFDGVELSLENSEPLLPAAINETTEMTRAIEHSVGLDQPRPGGLRFQSSSTEIAEIHLQAEAVGLELPSISTMQLFYYPLSSPIPEVSERAQEIVRKMILATAQLGGEVVLIAPGMVTPDSPYEETWMRSQAMIADLLPFAAHHGVTLALENIWNKFLLSPLEFAAYIDAFDQPNIGAYFDVANVLRFGFPDQWITTLGKRLKRIHFKDYRLDLDNVQGFTYLMQGDVPWIRVIQALTDVGYDGWVIVEVPPYPTHPDQVFWDSMAALRRLFEYTVA